MNSFVSAGDVFEKLLGDINYKDTELYPFKCRVGVIKYRPPRHKFFEYIINLGAGHIEPILYHKKFKPSSVLTFVFPERHMSVHEQRSFMFQLVKHPQVKKIKQIDILTSSPLLVGDFRAEMIRIIEWPDVDNGVLIPFVDGPEAAFNKNTARDVF